MNEPSSCLDIVVADGDVASACSCRQALASDGHRVIHARNGRQLAELCRVAAPDVIVTNLHLPDGPALPAVAEVTRDRRVPVVVVAADVSAEVLHGAGDLPVEAVLVKPVTPATLRAVVAAAVRSFGRAEALHAEVASLRQQLADRKVIERAKGAVVRRLGVDEQEAFGRMRKLSSDRNAKLVEVAARVLESEQVFVDLEVAGRPVARIGLLRHGGNGTRAGRPENLGAIQRLGKK